MFASIIKVFKPPYKIHDLPAFLGILILFLTIPVITLNLTKTSTQNVKAAALPCPNFGNFGDVNSNGFVDVTDVDLVANNLYNTPFWTPDKIKRADVDGNGKIEFMDVVSIKRYKDGSSQQITFKVCADNDNDGFTNLLENYIFNNTAGQYYPCGINKWPVDINNDQRVTLSDVLSFPPLNTKKGDANFSQRYDLNGDGVINQSGDLKILEKYWNKTCQILTFPVVPPSTLTATPNPVIAGDSVTLSWDIKGEVTKPCFQIEGEGFNGVVATKGSHKLSVYSIGIENLKYTIECGGYNGGVIKSKIVVAISPCPTYIKTGQLYRLTADTGVHIINPQCQKQLVNSPEAMSWCRYDWSKIQTSATVDKYLPYVVVGSAIGVGSTCPPGPTVTCGGNLKYTMNGQKDGAITVNSGDSVTSSGFGLSNCDSNDKLYLQYFNWDSSSGDKWTALNLHCVLSSGGACNISWKPSDKLPLGRNWPIRMTLNQSGNGSGTVSYDRWVNVKISQAAPPPTASCTGSPILSLSQTTVTSGSGTTITARSSGFANCGSSTTQFFWIKPVTRNEWQWSDNFGQCNFGANSSECSISFSQPNDIGRYVVLVTAELPNGTKEDVEYLDVIAPPPPTPTPTPGGGSSDEIKNFIISYVGGRGVTADIAGGGYYQSVNIGQFLFGLAGCESGWTPSAYAGPNYYEKGLYQYQAKNISGYPDSLYDTWGSAVTSTGGTLGSNIWSYQDQVRVTNWKVRASGGSNVNAWSCYTGGGWRNFISTY